MRHLTLYTSDKDFKHLIELAKNLHYVKKNETDEDSDKEILENVKRGFEEMKLIKKGKLKTASLSNFLNEL